MKVYDEEETVLSRRNGADEHAPELTVFLPVMNEEANLRALQAKLDATLDALPCTTEIIYVDDGSTDGSYEVLRDLARHDTRVRVIRLRRNFGKMAAMSAAIDYARGRILIAMDADLQNDPADIPRLIVKLEEGFDVVCGWREKRQDKLITRRFPSILANRLISWSSGIKLHDYGCCLKAYRREALKDVRLYGEMHRFIPVWLAMAGARVTEIPVRHHARMAGVSKFGKLSRTFEVILDLIFVKYMTTYRMKPIHFFGMFGLTSIAVSALAFLLSLILRLQGTPFSEMSLPIFATVMFALGVQLIFMGMIAEVLMRTYYEAQAKTTYSIGELIGFDESREPARVITERDREPLATL